MSIKGNVVGIVDPLKTIILVDKNGNEAFGIVTANEVILDANAAMDIREGKLAVTNDGIVTGEKIIPSCHIIEGVKFIMAGEPMSIRLNNMDMYDYTKLQVVICAYNTSLSNSVSAEKVSINDKVFNVGETISLADVLKDHDSKSIVLGIINNSTSPVILRYFTYKEI